MFILVYYVFRDYLGIGLLFSVRHEYDELTRFFIEHLGFTATISNNSVQNLQA